MGTTRARRARPAIALLAVIAIVGLAPASASGSEGGASGWVRIDGDFVIAREVYERQKEGAGPAAVTVHEGYEPFDLRNNGDYVIRLTHTSEGDIEDYRAMAEAAAAEINALNGLSVVVGDDVAPQPANQLDPPLVGEEIVVMISSQSGCGSSGWVGCAGPSASWTIDGEDRFAAGVVWLHPTADDYGPDTQRQVLFHELGHALGLDHYGPDFEGQRQMMYPSVDPANPITSYRSGDQYGLQWLVGDAPANDDIADALVVGPGDALVEANTWFAKAEAAEPAHAGQGPRRSTWFRFTPAGNQLGTTMVIDTGGGGDWPFDDVLAVYSGDSPTHGTLTPVVSSDDCGASPFSRVSFPLENTTYWIAVDGWFGDPAAFTWGFSRGEIDVDFDFAPGQTRFADVGMSHPFYDAVQWMWTSCTSNGTENPTGKPSYKPLDDVRRQAMAAFLYRLAGSPTVSSTPHFADVGTSHQFFREIQWMFESGTSTGSVNPAGGKPVYKPTDVVRRQAMAAFLYRLDGSDAVSATPHFADVGTGHQFFEAVQWMFESGTSTGSTNPSGGDPLYKPSDDVLRQAMAAFLFRIHG